MSYAVQTDVKIISNNQTRKFNTMKEITFEELIEPLKIGGFEGWYSVEFISTGKVKELLQQVREATIAECSIKVFHFLGNSPESFEICAIIDELPTDRIKTEK